MEGRCIYALKLDDFINFVAGRKKRGKKGKKEKNGKKGEKKTDEVM